MRKHQMGFVLASAISACAMLCHACVPLEPGYSHCFWLSGSKRPRFPVLCSPFHVVTSAESRVNGALPLKPERSFQVSQRQRLEDMLVLGHWGGSRIPTQVNVLLSLVTISERPGRGEAAVCFCSVVCLFFSTFHIGNSLTRSIMMIHHFNLVAS